MAQGKKGDNFAPLRVLEHAPKCRHKATTPLVEDGACAQWLPPQNCLRPRPGIDPATLSSVRRRATNWATHGCKEPFLTNTFDVIFHQRRDRKHTANKRKQSSERYLLWIRNVLKFHLTLQLHLILIYLQMHVVTWLDLLQWGKKVLIISKLASSVPWGTQMTSITRGTLNI